MSFIRLPGLVLSCAIALTAFQRQAHAGPSLVVDIATGKVLEQEDATRPWYPASLTKLLTVYVTLSAIRDGRVSLDTPFLVSARAASMPPSKMGFKPGTEVTLDNALKMMMVKSANDLAVVIAEGLDGSVENFADEMNRTAAKLGLQDSHFANPNGLPDPDHYSSARDLAVVALALFHDFPQYGWLYDIGSVKLGRIVVRTTNNILGRYPGIDGMKTGYTCASGFNLVASDTRGGRHVLAVVLGSPTVKARTLKAGALLDAAFQGLFSEGADLRALAKSSYAQPTDIHSLACGPHRPTVDEMPPMPSAANAAPGGLPPEADQIYAARPPRFDPMPVFVGPKPGWTGPIAEATGSPPPLPVSAYASLNDASAPPAPVKAAVSASGAHRRRSRGVARHKAKGAVQAAAVHSKAAASQNADSPHVTVRKRRAKRLSRSARTAAKTAPQKITGGKSRSGPATAVVKKSGD